MRARYKILYVFTVTLALACAALGQAGRRPGATPERSILLNVFAAREDNSENPVTAKDLALYDGGIEQTIQNFSPDPTPARIVLLVDNSQGLRADVEKLREAAREFAYEIYEGDQLMIVGYDKQAEIISEWTDDAKKVEATLSAFRKHDEPYLFDALSAVMEQALQPLAGGIRKRVIVVIGDGLDRGSKTSFDNVLNELQKQDVTVYFLQLPDRSGGAFRRDRPKAAQVIEKLVEGTGGRTFKLDEARNAAKVICDELRKNRYVLSYAPTSYSLTEARRLFLAADPGITLRHKTIVR